MLCQRKLYIARSRGQVYNQNVETLSTSPKRRAVKLEESILNHGPAPDCRAVLRDQKTDGHELDPVGFERDHPLLIIKFGLGLSPQTGEQRNAGAIDISVEHAHPQPVLRHGNGEVVSRGRLADPALTRRHTDDVLGRARKVGVCWLAALSSWRSFSSRRRLRGGLTLGLCGGDDLGCRYPVHGLERLLHRLLEWNQRAGAVGGGFEHQTDQALVFNQPLDIACINQALSIRGLDAVQGVTYLIEHDRSHYEGMRFPVTIDRPAKEAMSSQTNQPNTPAPRTRSGGPIVVGLAGWSGSGKTALARALISAMRARGLRVATLKHAHHGFDVDTPGKDSFEHRAAGASEVIVASSQRIAHMIEDPLPDPDERRALEPLLARLGPVDVVLVEGFKRAGHPKLEVSREALGKPRLLDTVPNVIAVATPSGDSAAASAVPVYDLNRPEDWIDEALALFAQADFA